MMIADGVFVRPVMNNNSVKIYLMIRFAKLPDYQADAMVTGLAIRQKDAAVNPSTDAPADNFAIMAEPLMPVKSKKEDLDRPQMFVKM